MILTFVGFGIAYPLTILMETMEQMAYTFFIGNFIMLTGLTLHFSFSRRKKEVFTNPPYSNGDRWYKP